MPSPDEIFPWLESWKRRVRKNPYRTLREAFLFGVALHEILQNQARSKTNYPKEKSIV